jgi:hypothetical protein
MEQVLQDGGTVTLVHFVFETEPEQIACMPNMIEFHLTQYHPTYHRSNDTRAVTCPACKRTDIFKRTETVLRDQRRA